MIKPCELLETPIIGQSASKLFIKKEKVQRLLKSNIKESKVHKNLWKCKGFF